MRLLLPVLLALVAVQAPLAARAAEPVDLALVLVSDVSRSIDDSEYELQKQGYAAAFRDPRVLAAIHGGMIGAIAVAYVEFAGSYEVRTVLGWRLVRSDADAAALAQEFRDSRRAFWGRTSISAGLDQAASLLAKAPFEAQRRAIDVSGDGTNNSGRDVRQARDEAVAKGITINGLAIINDHPVSYNFAHVQPPGGLGDWYRQQVIGGAGSFVVEVHDFHAFGEAMTRKLISEIASAE